MNAAIVVTSISPPTPSMSTLAEGCRTNGTRLICIGDQSSPQEYPLDGCRFYSLSEQRSLPFRLAGVAPCRHYSRKNIGYLVAASEGAEIILETDDDNEPLAGFWNPPALAVEGRYLDVPGWANVYAFFSDRKIWPRGLPLESLSRPAFSESAILSRPCPIQQGLANGDPDVDAVFRLTRDLPFHFDPRPPVILAPGTWSPFNSQNTLWWREAFELLYLPTYCSFRMTDIWRSFVAQRCLWEEGGAISFHAPTVFQDRNAHNLLKDFEQEIPGYLHNARIIQTLDGLELRQGPHRMRDNMRACYRALIALGVIGDGESRLLDAWAEDIASLLP
jgi:hypothetical protein